MPKPDFRVKDESGFTLAEVLVSAALILLITLTFSPFLLFVLETSEKNRIRAVATSLANEVIEELRTMPFDDIGLEEGSPGGTLALEEERTVDGRKYKIKTIINWLELDESGYPSWDYKGIRVTVSPKGLFASKGTTVIAETAVSRDYALPPLKGANIRIYAYRGWLEEGRRLPVRNLRISAIKNKKRVSAWTNALGKALFLELDEGTYTVEPVLDSVTPSMIMMPGTSFFKVAVAEGSITEDIIIELEIPCSLKVKFTDPEGNALPVSGKVTLCMPFMDENGEALYKEKKITGSSSVSFTDLWPVGDGFGGAYYLTLTGEALSYDMSIDDNKPLRANGSPWDGTFEAPGTSLTVTLALNVNDED